MPVTATSAPLSSRVNLRRMKEWAPAYVASISVPRRLSRRNAASPGRRRGLSCLPVMHLLRQNKSIAGKPRHPDFLALLNAAAPCPCVVLHVHGQLETILAGDDDVACIAIIGDIAHLRLESDQIGAFRLLGGKLQLLRPHGKRHAALRLLVEGDLDFANRLGGDEEMTVARAFDLRLD